MRKETEEAMKEFEISAKEMIRFINESPSCFHAVHKLRLMLEEQEYEELQEKDTWVVKPGGKYFTVRSDSSIAAFQIPMKQIKGYHMVASHSDSPTFKIKENAEITVDEQYVKLNTEPYGGMIFSTWMDRPLSVAGRVVVKENGKLVTKLVNIDKDLLIIPNVAIHMNRTINSGIEYNPQVDLIPLYGGITGKDSFQKLIADTIGVRESEILGSDLYLYVREKGKRIGANGEFICSPKLDDLQCAYSSMKALSECEPESFINVCVVFDNEEVGSGTKQGADSTFLSDVLLRIQESLGEHIGDYRKLLAESFLISADNAHAVHPNHTEKADPTNKPYLNGGIVIKHHGGQKYATDAYSDAMMKEICEKAKVPYQSYANRSDVPGGSTLGNLSTAHVSVKTVDIGLPQLAMHSAYETGGIKDTEYLIRALKFFYSE